MNHTQWTNAFIGLGANLGDREASLCSALHMVEKNTHTRMVAVSSLYETKPIGYIPQPPFLNAVACIETRLAAEDLLDTLLFIEREHGRRRNIHWGPRTLDLDILLYGDLRIASRRLAVPHPRLYERAFVLVPLLDLSPWLSQSVKREAEHAILHLGRAGVVKYKDSNWVASTA